MLIRWRQSVTATDLVVWGIGLAIGIGVIYGSIQTIRAAQYTPEQWINLTIDGLKLGEIYALIALGYTLVYDILRMINFAHSEIFMAGPFIAFFVATPLVQSGFMDRSPFNTVLGLTLSMINLPIMAMQIRIGLTLWKSAGNCKTSNKCHRGFIGCPFRRIVPALFGDIARLNHRYHVNSSIR